MNALQQTHSDAVGLICQRFPNQVGLPDLLGELYDHLVAARTGRHLPHREGFQILYDSSMSGSEPVSIVDKSGWCVQLHEEHGRGCVGISLQVYLEGHDGQNSFAKIF